MPTRLKKIFTVSLFLVVSYFLFNVSFVSATGHPVGSIELPNPLGPGATFFDLINKIIDFIFTIGIPIAGAMIIWAGFRFVTSGGNPQAIQSAKNTILYTIVGVVILVLAKGAIRAICEFFEATTC